MDAPDVLTNAAVRYPSHVAVVEGDRRRTFAEADHRADRAATALRDAGLRAGDRAALLAENELEYLELMVATQRAGVVLVPLNYRLSTAELRYILVDCAADLLIHGNGFAEVARELAVEHTWHLGTGGHGRPYDECVAAAPRIHGSTLDAAATAVILYTSGTTGRPKGAVVSNGALAARFLYFALETGARAGDVFVQTLPQFHMSANVTCGFAYRGATTVTLLRYDTAVAIDAMERHRATHVLLVPTTINQVSEELHRRNADLAALRLLMYGASPIPPQVLRRAMAVLPCDFLQMYGMTETGAVTALLPEEHDPVGYPERLAAAGKQVLHMRIRVVDAQDRDLPSGTVGEIVCRGPGVMDGYWNDDDASALTLRSGWMHTGDLGFKDDDGYVFVTDRIKDMIISGGENVYPREVEDVLHEHPAVLEAAVIGIPDERWGEAVHALVVLREASATEVELIAHCRARLAGYKTPKSVDLVAELPRTPTGKVLKRELRGARGHDRC